MKNALLQSPETCRLSFPQKYQFVVAVGFLCYTVKVPSRVGTLWFIATHEKFHVMRRKASIFQTPDDWYQSSGVLL